MAQSVSACRKYDEIRDLERTAPGCLPNHGWHLPQEVELQGSKVPPTPPFSPQSHAPQACGHVASPSCPTGMRQGGALGTFLSGRRRREEKAIYSTLLLLGWRRHKQAQISPRGAASPDSAAAKHVIRGSRAAARRGTQMGIRLCDRHDAKVWLFDKCDLLQGCRTNSLYRFFFSSLNTS